MKIYCPADLPDCNPIFQALGSAAAAASDERLHQAVFDALAAYFCFAHDKLTTQHLQGLLQLTEICFASGDGKRIIDVLDVWTSLAKTERGIRPGSPNCFAVQCIPALFGPVYNLIGLDAFQSMDDSEWRVSRSALNLLKRMCPLAEPEVCELLQEYARVHFGDNDEVTILRVLVGMQLLAESSIEELNEFLQGAFSAVLSLSTAALPKLAMGAFAVIQSLFLYRKTFANEVIYNTFCGTVHQILTSSHSADVIGRAVCVTHSFFTSCARAHTNGYLAARWGQLLALLSSGLQNPVVLQTKGNLVLSIYGAIGGLVRSLPQEFVEFLDGFACDLVRQLQATFVDESALSKARRAGIAVIVTDLFERFGQAAIAHCDALAVPLFQAVESEIDDQDILKALSTLFYMGGDRLDAYAARGLEVALAALGTSNKALVQPACLLAGDVLDHRHRQFMGGIFTLVDVSYQWILQSVGDDEILRHFLTLLSRVLFVEHGSDCADILKEIGDILLPVRRQIMITFANLQRRLPRADIEVAHQMMRALMRIYQGVALMYDHEAIEVNGRKRPGEFLAEFMDDYKTLIDTGHDARIDSDAVLKVFLDYVLTGIKVFGSFQNFNVRIHARSFNSYFHLAQKSNDRSIRHSAESAKYHWDHS
jgi:hypothetical protein